MKSLGLTLFIVALILSAAACATSAVPTAAPLPAIPTLPLLPTLPPASPPPTTSPQASLVPTLAPTLAPPTPQPQETPPLPVPTGIELPEITVVPIALGTPTPPPTNTPLPVTPYKVGDTIQAGNLAITLNKATWQYTALTAEFTVENKGTYEVRVSPTFFSAKDVYGNTGGINPVCTAKLDGNVPVGGKLTGNLCWIFVSSVKGLRIFISNDLTRQQGPELAFTVD
jgi:hypothetical protein